METHMKIVFLTNNGQSVTEVRQITKEWAFNVDAFLKVNWRDYPLLKDVVADTTLRIQDKLKINFANQNLGIIACGSSASMAINLMSILPVAKVAIIAGRTRVTPEDPMGWQRPPLPIDKPWKRSMKKWPCAQQWSVIRSQAIIEAMAPDETRRKIITFSSWGDDVTPPPYVHPGPGVLSRLRPDGSNQEVIRGVLTHEAEAAKAEQQGKISHRGLLHEHFFGG